MVIENKAPYNSSAIEDLNINELETGNYTIPTFTDDEGDTIEYDLLNLPSWMTYNDVTNNITYTAPDYVTMAQFDLSVTDNKNDAFEHTITVNIDLKPQLNTSVVLFGNMVSQVESNFTIDGRLFSDEATASLSYELLSDDGSAAPSWLTLTSPTIYGDDFVISGQSDVFTSDNIDVMIKVTDINGLVNSALVEIQMEGKHS